MSSSQRVIDCDANWIQLETGNEPNSNISYAVLRSDNQPLDLDSLPAWRSVRVIMQYL